MTREEYKERKLDLQRRYDRLLQEEIKADDFLDELGCNNCEQDGACDGCKGKKLCDAVFAAAAKRGVLTIECGELRKQYVKERAHHEH